MTMELLGPFLADFTVPEAPDFRPVNDQVMGGRSVSRWRLDPEGFGVFEGLVSLARGGGFASARAALENTDLSANDGVLLRVRGDGQRYRLILRNDRRFSGVNHMHDFTAPEGDWTEVFCSFDAFRPSRMGYTPRDAAPLDPARIRQMGLMIAERQEGPFHLELAWVRGAGTAAR
jgi:monofunctional biosynthetic peptidoglycan transglycosylase